MNYKLTIEKLMEFLSKYPKDSMVYHYEGEACGFGVHNKEDKLIAFIHNDGRVEEFD